MKDQAVDVINKSRLMYLATIDEDGNPRSTILTIAAVNDNYISWHSSPDAEHSKNITRNNKVGASIVYEVPETNESCAVYISGLAKDIGNVQFNDEKQHTTHEYIVWLGEYDEVQSKPNRLYFKESK